MHYLLTLVISLYTEKKMFKNLFVRKIYFIKINIQIRSKILFLANKPINTKNKIYFFGTTQFFITNKYIEENK